MGLIKCFTGEFNAGSQGFRKLLLFGVSSSLFDVNVKIVPDKFQSQIADLECNENLKLFIHLAPLLTRERKAF